MLPASDHVEPGDLMPLLSGTSKCHDRSTLVQLVETHISWVFITQEFVYKIKKPVRFDFLDFSTIERRRQACLEEVRLNRRLAPGVYLGLLPITWSESEGLALAGSGEPVDWAVKMRRLPSELALDRKLSAEDLTHTDVEALVNVLTAFYREARRATVSGQEYRSILERAIRTNADECMRHFSQIHKNRICVILGRQLVYLHCATAVLDERAESARIVEGHGDLRPEHVYLESPPVIIDCLEFSPALRRVDVLDDLAYLAMELDRLGHHAIGERIIGACQASLGDCANPRLMELYKTHHALVRAKVMMLQAAQRRSDGRRACRRLAHQYVDWAEHDAAQLGHPLLIIVGGLMGTGKSTLAKHLVEGIGAEMLSTDFIRRSRFGPSSSPAQYSAGLYTPNRRTSVYKQLFDTAATLVDKDRSVVLDGTFLQRELRERAASIARQHGAIPLYVHCSCPRDVALSRLATRAANSEGDSEGRPDLFDEQVAQQESPSIEPRSVSIDTTRDINEQRKLVFDAMAKLDSI